MKIPRLTYVQDRGRWRYQRAVPERFFDVAGAKLWTRSFGAVSRDDAKKKRDKTDAEFEALIVALARLSPDARADLVALGGLRGVGLAKYLAGAEAQLHGATARLMEDAPLSGRQERYAQTARSARRQQAAAEGRASQFAAIIDKVTPSPQGQLAPLISMWRVISAPRSRLTEPRMRLYLGRFVAAVGDMAPKDVTRQHARDFRDWLSKQPKQARSADKHLHAMSRLFKIAMSEGAVDTNPFQGVKPHRQPGWKIADADKRHAFSAPQARLLLDALDALDLTQERWRDFRQIFRLLIYHGCRSGEVCHMTPADVYDVRGITVFKTHDAVDGVTIKNVHSVREVPIHPACKDFIEYATAAKAANQQWLFKSLPSWRTGRAGKFQQLATKFVRATLKTTDRKLTTHSARHYWRGLADDIDMPETVSRSITGHRLGGDDHNSTYLKAPKLEKRYEWICRIDPRAG